MGLKKRLQPAYTFCSQAVLSRMQFGESVFQRDWDLLIVLDACRVDALRQVCSEFTWLPEKVESTWSLGSTSKEWTDRTFVPEHIDRIRETAIVSSNPFIQEIKRDNPDPLTYNELDGSIFRSDLFRRFIAHNVVEPQDFALFDCLVKSNSDEPDESFHPNKVTDHAIWVGRYERPKNCIVHYMQPHAPYYVTGETYNELTPREKEPFGSLKSGNYSKQKIFQDYIDNLRFVLNHVDRLIRNYDADTVAITADHGELFGEWGIYAHQAGVLHPNLRKVPWAVTSSSDERTSEPDISESDIGIEEASNEEQLKALGYL